MPRTVPPPVAALIRDVPADFRVECEDHGHYVRWSATLTVSGHGPADVEIGFSKASGKADENAEMRNLRHGAWQLMELARIGRIDLMGHTLVDRHKRRSAIKRAAT